jgi:hypothetical protein
MVTGVIVDGRPRGPTFEFGGHNPGSHQLPVGHRGRIAMDDLPLIRM